MKAKTKAMRLCLFTLFASSFVTQAAGPKVVNTLKNSKFLVENQAESVNKSHDEHNCGTDHNGQDWKKLQKEFVKQIKAKKHQAISHQLTKSKAITSYSLESSEAVDGRYYIPVVMHVYGDAYNCADDAEKCLTDAKIEDALRKLNDDFQGLSVDTPAINPIFAAIRENLNIEFVLAKKDPDGNPTNGIVRYAQDKSGYGNGDAAIQDDIAADSWDNFKYMNVYLQNDLHADGKGNYSGVAWYPDLSMTEAGTSRVVYNPNYVGLNTNENFRSVLTHEFGHWLNLIHTFENKVCSITNEAFCSTTGDRTCDTPQMSMPSQMQNNAMNCLGQPTNTENFMHYTDNYAMFTKDQVDRMTAALHGPARSTLWSNENLVATGLEQYVSSAVHHWDGVSGIDLEPEGEVLLSHENISAPLDGIETFEVNLPLDATNVLFYLDGFTEDPDMYVSSGEVPTPPEAGSDSWIADFISFNSPGTTESVSLDIPDTTAPYYASVHAFTQFNDARLRVIQGNDPYLAEGERRYTLFKIENLWANKTDPMWEGRLGKQHTYQFTVPDDATRVVVVVPGNYQGPKMADGSINKNGDLDLHVSRNKEVSLESYDCRPYSWKVISEYCEFDGGGTFNVMIDPFQTYTAATLHVYYETANTGNQLPFANTNGTLYEEAVGHTIQFNSNGSNDPDGDIVSYLWNFGDGSESTSPNANHIYTSEGEYNVTLTVTDNLGESTTATTKAVVTLNSPKDAPLCEGCTRYYLNDEIDLTSIAGDTPKTYYFEAPDAASLVTFELVSRYSGDPDIHISQNQDVSIEQYDCRPWNSPGQTELCQFTSGGVFNVMIDPYKDYDSLRFRAYYDIHDDADHSAPNKLPIAHAGGNYTALSGYTVTFDGSQSSDADGTISEYLWDFGHGETQTGQTTTRTYPNAGTYFVTLTVTDNNGAAHQNTVQVTITPVGDMDGDGDVDSDDIRALSLAISQGQILDDSFDINNDGVINEQDARALRDLCSYDRCSTVKPTPQAPIAVATALNNDVQVNTDVRFSSEGSSDQYGQIVTYAWDFGDGNNSDWSSPTHQYTQPGIYDVTLTLTDNDGMTAITSVQVNIAHEPLTDICSTAPATNERDLVPSEPTCVGTEDSLTIPQVNRHKTIAISMINAPEDSLVYFGAGSWPRIHTNEYTVVSTAQDGQQCAFYTIPEDATSWGYIQLSGTPVGATIVVDYDVASCRPTSNQLPADNSLQNGIIKTVSGSEDEELHFTMDVPANVNALTIGTSGGIGDTDMYVKFGSAPTSRDYDCRPWKVGSKETCNFDNAQAGTYYIMLVGYNDFTDIELLGSYIP